MAIYVVSTNLWNTKSCRNLGEKASVEYIDKAGHLSPMERPFVFTQCLRKVLSSFQTEVKNK